jgi:hypothetical protein
MPEDSPDPELSEEDEGPLAAEGLRSEEWLRERMGAIISVYYSDLPDGYPIIIRYGNRARYRFGSIAARNGKSIILINRLFSLPEVPAYVVDETIAHELAHYVHGFGSGLPRKYADPHRGGVVDKELARRGLSKVEQASTAWRKLHWEALYNRYCPDLAFKKEVVEAVTDQAWAAVTKAANARTDGELAKIVQEMFHAIGARVGDPVFGVEWLHASLRQTGTSYYFSANKTVKLHGLLADRRVPESVVRFEIAYWAMRFRGVKAWPVIEKYLRSKGLEPLLDEALLWRQQKWNGFRTRNHPLARSKR